jgi:hypothetical protein
MEVLCRSVGNSADILLDLEDEKRRQPAPGANLPEISEIPTLHAQNTFVTTG